MTPELVTYILTVSLGIVVGLALSATRRSVYTRWLERKLATTRIELAKLKDTRQQPWLQGATKEYHLQKRIAELETELEEAKMLTLHHATHIIGLEAEAKKVRCPHCGMDSKRGY